MNCQETYCLTASEFVPLFTRGAFEVRIGYQSGRPFAAILIDNRDGTHLHLPADDVLPMLTVRRKY